MPSIISDLLSADWFNVAARVVLTSFFWIAGIFGIAKFGMMVKVIEARRLPKPAAIVAAMIVTELGGSILLITDYRSLGWLGAGWLGVFTFLSIPLGHPFWKYPPPKNMEEFQIALEHVAVVGGLMCAAVLTTL
ncbi:DoxX family protein [Glacieibacterium frigidum]|uniref:DoxX family membrane protein n=1 Tax=Glacieibacterium frigidum TaxID=2593303 RepID=A0A552U8D7_9SPHN|nr:DoxX family membrane protein [Glacieibacterium frigidum]TRW14480.1 DoxX family membrane protein [Glacieibacterium frigidum]